MRTPYPEIRRCLDAHLLAALPGIGLAASDVAWPNAAFAPVAERMYLRPSCVYGETAVASLGEQGFERLTGVYQVSVLEVAGVGLERAERAAAAVTDHFRGGTWLEHGEFTVCIRVSFAGAAVKEEDRLHIPVSVIWRCDTQK